MVPINFGNLGLSDEEFVNSSDQRNVVAIRNLGCAPHPISQIKSPLVQLNPGLRELNMDGVKRHATLGIDHRTLIHSQDSAGKHLESAFGKAGDLNIGGLPRTNLYDGLLRDPGYK